MRGGLGAVRMMCTLSGLVGSGGAISGKSRCSRSGPPSSFARPRFCRHHISSAMCALKWGCGCFIGLENRHAVLGNWDELAQGFSQEFVVYKRKFWKAHGLNDSVPHKACYRSYCSIRKRKTQPI